jgi:hypothetical protein
MFLPLTFLVKMTGEHLKNRTHILTPNRDQSPGSINFMYLRDLLIESGKPWTLDESGENDIKKKSRFELSAKILSKETMENVEKA